MRNAIVIGASSGIGRELAKLLSRNGYALGVMARRIDLLETLRHEVDGPLMVQAIDVAQAETAMVTLEKFIEALGGVDLVVISAGTGDINPDLSWPVENETIQTNAVGFAALTNVAMRHFIKQGRGHLVGISSIAALRGGRESPAYNASKAFVSNYLEGLRAKVRKAGLPITVTDIQPGFVQTVMAKGEGIFWAAEVDKAARQIFDAIQKHRPQAYITRRWRLVAWLIKALPGCVYERL